MSQVKRTYWDDLPHDYQYRTTTDLEYVSSFLAENCESVFEAATGSGILPTLLRQRGWKGRYLGSDYNNNFLKAAKENNPNENFICVDLLDEIPLLDNEFDACVVRHGLEYVYPYSLALDELARIARKFVILTFWVDFFDRPNQIRFNQKGKWNVNFYNRDEFYEIVGAVGLDVKEDIEIIGDKFNRVLILCPNR